MPQNQQFAIVQFSRRGNGGLDMLLLDSRDGSSLQVLVNPDWKKRVDLPDQAYLTELMDEWKSAKHEQIPKILDEICRQSHGPVRMIERGEVSLVGRQALIDRIAGVIKPS